jgi:hypothetical protein
MTASEQTKMKKQLVRDGYRVVMDGQGHWEVFDAEGRFLASFPGTTSNRRWKDNLRTDIRRRERAYAQEGKKVS